MSVENIRPKSLFICLLVVFIKVLILENGQIVELLLGPKILHIYLVRFLQTVKLAFALNGVVLRFRVERRDYNNCLGV